MLDQLAKSSKKVMFSGLENEESGDEKEDGRKEGFNTNDQVLKEQKHDIE